MLKMCNKQNKKNNGISLIVLIITIAVILILAGAIILSVSTNRPIETAEQARDAHNDSLLEEHAKILSAQWEVDTITGDTDKDRDVYVTDGLKELGFEQDQIDRLIIDKDTGEVTWNN